MSDHIAFKIASVHRVANRFVEADTMTEPEAKKVLGFPPSSHPTPEEINKVWKHLAIQNHPDRGGNLELMKQINRARDALLNPKPSRGAPPGGWGPQDEVRKKEPPKVVETIPGVPFAHAVSKVPGGVDWKFISTQSYVNNHQTNTSSNCWCAVGQTSSHWVVVGIQRRLENRHYDIHKDGLIQVEESWAFQVKESPISGDSVKMISLMIKGAVGMFEDGTIPELPKKFIAFKDFSEATIKAVKGSGGVSLKDILLSTGMVSGDAKGVAGRKSIVEIWTKYSSERRQRMQEKSNKIYSHDTYDFFVRVNGHEFKLEDDTIKNLEKNGFLGAVFGYKFSEGAPKQLNRLRGGLFKAGPAEAIHLLADALTSEPSSLIIALQKAAEEWEPESKTASDLEEFAIQYGVDEKIAFQMLLSASEEKA